MPNVSEMYREQEELIDEGLDILRGFENNHWSKTTKMCNLNRLRDIESRLKLPGFDYNTPDFIERSRDALLHLQR